MNAPTSRDLIIWGHSHCQPPRNKRVVLWGRFADHGEHVSLPEMIHGSPDRWKAEYARWLRDAGSSYVLTPQARLFEQRHGGLSYWWMTLPTAFAFSRESVPYAVLRLMALVDFLKTEKPKKIVLESIPNPVREVLEGWGLASGVRVEIAESLSCLCPDASQGPKKRPFSTIRYLLSVLVRFSRRSVPPAGSGLAVFDYLTVTPDERIAYGSRFWGPLEPLLKKSLPTIWLHFYTPDTGKRTTLKAQKFDPQTSHHESRHFLLQNALTVRTWTRALVTLRSIRKIGRKAWPMASFIDSQRGIDLRPLVASRWEEDHRGTRAAVNALDVHLMASSVSRLTGAALYLMENQPWEVALLHAWKKQNRMPISGFVHSRAREWDFRYLLPLYGPIGSPPVWAPMPDQCLVGSSRESQIMQANGYSRHKICEVEALRFLATERPSPYSSSVTESVRVLVLGEYDDESSAQLAHVLRMSDSSGLHFAFRPHPSRKESNLALPTGASLSLEPSLSSALKHCDAVIAYSTSTAVHAAVQLGKPVIVIQDGAVLDGLDLPPSSVFRVPLGTPISPQTIADCIRISTVNASENASQHLDNELHRWGSWIEEVAKCRR